MDAHHSDDPILPMCRPASGRPLCSGSRASPWLCRRRSPRSSARFPRCWAGARLARAGRSAPAVRATRSAAARAGAGSGAAPARGPKARTRAASAARLWRDWPVASRRPTSERAVDRCATDRQRPAGGCIPSTFPISRRTSSRKRRSRPRRAIVSRFDGIDADGGWGQEPVLRHHHARQLDHISQSPNAERSSLTLGARMLPPAARWSKACGRPSPRRCAFAFSRRSASASGPTTSRSSRSSRPTAPNRQTGRGTTARAHALDRGFRGAAGRGGSVASSVRPKSAVGADERHWAWRGRAACSSCRVTRRTGPTCRPPATACSAACRCRHWRTPSARRPTRSSRRCRRTSTHPVFCCSTRR